MSQKRRIFIAVNLPKNVKRRILDFQKKWEGFPFRWTKKDSLHLTLVFIGYADEQEIYEVCRMARDAAKQHEPLDIYFEKIIYGPPVKPPRMIWLKGRFSEEASRIKNDLEEIFAASQNLRGFRPEKRFFSPHITLARINMEDWHNLSEKPLVEGDFKAVVPVTSIDVMESELKRSGAEYTILESCPLKY